MNLILMKIITKMNLKALTKAKSVSINRIYKIKVAILEINSKILITKNKHKAKKI
jgi:hypothetical protein